MVKVTNNFGDIGYDIFEFYTNKKPYARELLEKSSDIYHNYTI